MIRVSVFDLTKPAWAWSWHDAAFATRYEAAEYVRHNQREWRPHFVGEVLYKRNVQLLGRWLESTERRLNLHGGICVYVDD